MMTWYEDMNDDDDDNDADDDGGDDDYDGDDDDDGDDNEDWSWYTYSLCQNSCIRMLPFTILPYFTFCSDVLSYDEVGNQLIFKIPISLN